MDSGKKTKVLNFGEGWGGYSGNQIPEFGLRKENESFEFWGVGGIRGIKSQNLDSGKKTKVLNLGGILGIKSQNVQNWEIILKIGIVFLKLHVDTGIIFVSLCLQVQNGISCLISALCVNCLISILRTMRKLSDLYSGIFQNY